MAWSVACCVRWEQGRFINKWTEPLEYGVICSSRNAVVLPGVSLCLGCLGSIKGAFRSRVSVFHEIRVGFPDLTVHRLCALGPWSWKRNQTQVSSSPRALG